MLLLHFNTYFSFFVSFTRHSGDVTEGTICLHLIGTLELSVQPKLHRTIFDGTNYLYAVTVIENTSNQSYNILVHRLDMVSNWTVVYDNVFLCALPDIYVLENYLRTENMFIYHSVLYVFPFNQRDNGVDFSVSLDDYKLLNILLFRDFHSYNISCMAGLCRICNLTRDGV